jgi:homopolymeric O-antigen transport system ATP-binding protein
MIAIMDETEGLSEAVAGAALDHEDWLIRASGLRKKYCRDLRRSLWYSLRDVVEALRLRQADSEILREDEFWAIDDVSFELRRGDSLGLLGRNGAGKSTLLKLLTGQRLLTAGTVVTRGRIVALTELGLGFDPVLTGRENAYVNAAVHGVSHRDFDKLIEQIIEFSELREFIDSAVHTYSTGMKARLGFSVATHLNPDILVVDEVLAVGDLDFRRKCVLHVQSFLRGGGSVMLVAHDPYLVQSICNRVIVLDRGRVVFEGSAMDGVDFHFRLCHMNMYAAVSNSDAAPLPQSDSNGVSKVTGFDSVRQEDPAVSRHFRLELTNTRQVAIDRIEVIPTEGEGLRTGYPAKVVISYRSSVRTEVGWGFTICTPDLQVNIASCAIGMDRETCSLEPGEHGLACLLPELLLKAGVYAIRGGIVDARSQAALAVRGYEDQPHFFTVVAPHVSRSNNWQLLQEDLVVMKVKWLS